MQGELLSGSGTLELHGHGRLEDYEPPALIDFERILNNPSDYLQECASFFYYELNTWKDHGLPLRSIALVREDWVHDGEGNYRPESKYQLSVEYKDGFGRTIQSKNLVEPGPDTIQYDTAGEIIVDPVGEPQLVTTDAPRYLVSGHVIYNNKLQPVQQYEPYFSPLVDFENDAVLETFGVSGWIEYDALGRQKRVIHADGTSNRVEVAPWKTAQYDANDDVVGSLYEARNTIFPPDTPEGLALEKSRRHQDTPVISHLDALGRAYLSEEADEHGRVRRNRTVLDILGNPKEILDARGLTAFSCIRDMQGRVFQEHNMDAGPKWQFLNALDQTIHLWDAREVHQQITYDTWSRVINKYVDGALGMDHLVERFIYGEDTTITNAWQRNLLGKAVENYDQAGLTRMQRFDISGNILEKDRRLLNDPAQIPDWTDSGSFVWMAGPPFETRVTYDALGRPLQQQLPDQTTRKFTYLQSGAVDRLLLTTTDGTMVEEPITQDRVFNAFGQTKELTLGNGVVQRYEYDGLNKHLKRKTSFRRSSGTLAAKQYQNINYTYDAVGNITHLQDNAQPNGTLLFNRPRINQYTYDAFYQLIEAEGRTHEAIERTDYAHAPDDFGFVKGTRHINVDNMALVRTYTRRYSYDLNGNMEHMIHNSGTRPGDIFRWRRDFWISTNSNRSIEQNDLAGNPISNPETRFDQNGNLNYLSHLSSVEWNYQNQLTSAVLIERTGALNDAEYYVYGGDGQRVRKVTQRLDSGTLESTEKIYLDGCEIKRIRRGDTLILERYTSHLSDGSERVALMHHWTIDTQRRETDDITGKKIHYQLSCHLGSSAFELDEQGEIINYEEYFAFGGSAFVFGTGLRDVQLKEYRYSGKERDDATGLYYYGFRYYVPWLCRWLNPDPIGPEDGLNLYQFVHNNPINEVDPDGLQSSEGGISISNQPFPIGSLSDSDLSRIREYSSDHPNAQIALLPDESGVPQLHLFDNDQDRNRAVAEFLETHPDLTVTFYRSYADQISEALEGAFDILQEGAATNSGEIMEGLYGSGGDEHRGSGTSAESPATSGRGAGTDVPGEGGSGPNGDENGTGNGELTEGVARRRRRGSEGGTGSDPRGAAGGRPGGTGVGSPRERIAGVPVGTEPMDEHVTPQLGSTDSHSSLTGDPNGTLKGPEEVHSELPVGPGNYNGSTDGSVGGQPWGTPPEELEFWQTALIFIAVLLVAIAVTALTFGAALAVLGATAATATIGQLIAAGAIAGLAAGLASDATSQLLNIAVSDQLTINDYDIGQTLYSGAVGAVTGGLTAGLGGYAAGARSAVTAGTATATQSAATSIANRMGSSLVTRGLVHFGAGAVEGGERKLYVRLYLKIILMQIEYWRHL